MRRIRFWLGLTMGVLLTLFALQNLQAVQVRFFLWYVELRLVTIIVASALVGALWTALWLAWARWRATRGAAAEAVASETAATQPSTTQPSRER